MDGTDLEAEIEAEFTDEEEEGVMEGVMEGFGKPKVTDVPFEKKDIPAAAPEEDKAKRYKAILLNMGFAKKEPQNGDGKESYSIHVGNMVIGRTFSEKMPNGKFWAIKDNKFLDEDEVRKQEIVQEFYDIRDGKKQQTLSNITPHTKGVATPEELVPITKEVPPARVISEAQGMATALYQVVEKQHLYMDIGGKKYLQLEAWQLLGKFCNVHGVVESVRPVEYFGTKGFEAKAIVRDSEGVVIAAAEAVCLDDEPNWKEKPLFQLKSMAQTRSLSKEPATVQRR
jgi:hypothetical protein